MKCESKSGRPRECDDPCHIVKLLATSIPTCRLVVTGVRFGHMTSRPSPSPVLNQLPAVPAYYRARCALGKLLQGPIHCSAISGAGRGTLGDIFFEILVGSELSPLHFCSICGAILFDAIKMPAVLILTNNLGKYLLIKPNDMLFVLNTAFLYFLLLICWHPILSKSFYNLMHYNRDYVSTIDFACITTLHLLLV